MVCFAAFDSNDVADKQPELGANDGSGRVGSAVEDRPGKSTLFIYFFELLLVII